MKCTCVYVYVMLMVCVCACMHVYYLCVRVYVCIQVYTHNANWLPCIKIHSNDEIEYTKENPRWGRSRSQNTKDDDGQNQERIKKAKTLWRCTPWGCFFLCFDSIEAWFIALFLWYTFMLLCFLVYEFPVSVTLSFLSWFVTSQRKSQCHMLFFFQCACFTFLIKGFLNLLINRASLSFYHS